jgi:hypothetical protein
MKNAYSDYCIIRKTKILFHLDFEFLDIKIVELFQKKSQFLSLNQKNLIKPLCSFLNCFLGLQNKKLSIIRFLNNKSTSVILSEFVYFLKQDGFSISKITRGNYISVLKYILKHINENTDNKIEIDSTIIFDFKHIKNEKINYFNGWWIKVHKETYSSSISLHDFYNKFGSTNTEILFNKIRLFSKENSSLFRSAVAPLNKFLVFIAKNSIQPFTWDKELIVKSFLKSFFIAKDENKHSLHNAKIEWNNFIQAAKEIFELTDDSVIVINIKEQKSFEHHIKQVGNKEIKTKLITDVPLEICDEKAFNILVEKINQDVSLIKQWASFTLNTYLNISKDNRLEISDYGRKRTPDSRAKTNNAPIFQKKHALAISYLLIVEHPEITESFLLNCDFYESIKETDQGTFLVSYKNRKGPELAEQKILLNDVSLYLINILLAETAIIREYLKINNHAEYRKLFIFCNSESLFPNAPKVLNEREGTNRDTNKSVINFLTQEKLINEQDAIKFANKITLTKLRASRGVQIYLETQSTTQMAKALGHTRHRPKLLAHYLPEPILDFFQRRWISIFQRGIICEALKDSEFLLKAANFSSMAQLDEFLKNHTLKKIPDNSNALLTQENKSLTRQDELYVSIDENKLAALLSIQKAVKESANKEQVASNAHYWATFTDRLTKEINDNRNYISFRKILVDAEKNINTDLFKEIIYVE